MSDAALPGAMSAQSFPMPFSLANHFLIAMPNMADPMFTRTVIYVCEHSEEGALGLVINRPTDLTLETLFDRVDLKLEIAPLNASPVLYGGPVRQDRGFVLHDQTEAQYHSTVTVDGGLALTMSKDVLEAVVQGIGPRRLLVTLGYAGWGEGQLEHEIGLNAWLTVPADPSIVFDIPPAERFAAAMQLLGIDPAMLSVQAGHA